MENDPLASFVCQNSWNHISSYYSINAKFNSKKCTRAVLASQMYPHRPLATKISRILETPCNTKSPVKNSRPHHAATGVHWDIYAECLVHPYNVSKAKVQSYERSDDGSQGRVRQPHDQNEQVIGKLN